MLNLTKSAATALKIDWKTLPERRTDCWKVDLAKIGTRTYWFVAHEQTLCMIARLRNAFRKPEQIAAEIARQFPWSTTNHALTLGRNSDRRLNGSFTEMKRAAHFYELPEELPSFEDSMNHNLSSYLRTGSNPYGNPQEALERYLAARTKKRDQAES